MQIISCYFFAQSHPVTPYFTKSKTADPDMSLESAMLWPMVTSFLSYFTTVLFDYCPLHWSPCGSLKQSRIMPLPQGFVFTVPLACNTFPLGSPKACSPSLVLLNCHPLRVSFSNHSVKNYNSFLPPVLPTLSCF